MADQNPDQQDSTELRRLPGQFWSWTPEEEARRLAIQQGEDRATFSSGRQADGTYKYAYTPTADLARRQGDWNYGMSEGRREFYEDPDMQRLRALREQYAQGYDSKELGDIRGAARSEIAGQRAQDQKRLSSNLARGGVGGARGAAMRNEADRKSGAQVMDTERKIAIDSAGMKRQGASDLQDFLFRQKYGQLGTAAGSAQLGSASNAATQAAKSGGGGGCFITTAACEYFELPDDCDQLTTLRWFRDNVMLTDEDLKADVKEYYELSKEYGPKLSLIDSKEFWTDVFEYIENAVAEIKLKKFDTAYATYRKLIDFVKGA